MKFQTKTISLPVPSISIQNYLTSLKTKLSNIYHLFRFRLSGLTRRLRLIKRSRDFNQDPYQEKKFMSLRNKTKKIFTIKYMKPLLYACGVIVIVLFGYWLLKEPDKNNDQRVEVLGAKAEMTLNREFVFPLKDGAGENISEIKYFIEKAEIRDQIITEGKKATAVKGRTFLILTLKVTNEYDKAIKINTRDYVRLSVNGNKDEWLAADIHNDPVEVQAQSTKPTRIGFPINDTDKELIIRVGEIDGDKEEIPLNQLAL